MSRANPFISVVMSVYNGEKFIERALLSLLAQSYEEFEVIVVDDGSTDSTLQILTSFADSRIKVIQQANMGLTKSLNRAISMSKGDWIARHDADDFSIYSRFENQLAYLEQNADIGLLGTSCFIQPESYHIINEVYLYPETDIEIKKAFCYYNPFVHGSIIIRKDLLLRYGCYDETYLYCQDYELWSRLICNIKVRNLPIPFYVRSIHKDASQVTIDKEKISKNIINNFVKRNPMYPYIRSINVQDIQSESVYPAITRKGGWNLLISETFMRMKDVSRSLGRPWLKWKLLSFLYCPFRGISNL